MLDIDSRLLSALRKNVRDISILGLSNELAQDRIRHLVLSGVASKFTTLCDFSKIGMHLHIAFAIAAEDKDGIKQWLSSDPAVNNLFAAGGDFDFFLDAYFRDMKSLWEFSEKAREFKVTKFMEYHIIHAIALEKAPIITPASSA